MMRIDSSSERLIPSVQRLVRIAALASLLLVGGVTIAYSQAVEVEGTVVSATDQQPLPGVNVVEEGTSQGTATGPNGQFSLEVSDAEATLVFNFVGFQEQRIDLNGRTEIQIALQQKVEVMEDVVVTAFGREQEQRGLGYSVEEVEGSDLAEARTNNLGEALQGKLPGVNIEAPSTGPTGSTRITVRGNANLTGNQPLIVIDGVPVQKNSRGDVGAFGGTDGGDALTTVNPQNIESLSVLKGASAAALYGSRAQNGVILIETRGGEASGDGAISAEYSGSLQAQRPKSLYDDFQQKYGQGTRGEAPSSQQEALNTALSSWGAPISEVDEAVQFDGEARPYEQHSDNISNFYNTGFRSEHSIAVTGTGENYNVRTSISRMDSDHILPTSRADRTNLYVRGGADVENSLRVEGKLSYSIQDTDFRPKLADQPANPSLSLAFMPTTLDVRTLDPHVDEDGDHRAWSNSPFRPNPYWGMREVINDTDTRSLRGFVSATYSFTEGISLLGRYGTDYSLRESTDGRPRGTPWDDTGNWGTSDNRRREDNFNLLLEVNRDLYGGVGVDATLGGEVRYQQNESVSASGGEIIVEGGPLTLNNTVGNMQDPGYGFSEKQINSLFARANFDYNSVLFLALTGRNDWSSTLPEDANSFFYPSVSTSFIFSDVFELPDVFSFGKVRGSWGQVGGDPAPYQLDLNYSPGGGHPSRTGGRVTGGGLNSSQVPPLGLEPKFKETIEFGTNLGFFDERLGLDFTWYREESTNQILSVSISNTSGFGSRKLNAGLITNQGVEIGLEGTILQGSEFNLDSRLNFTANENEVVELSEKQKSFGLGGSRSRRTRVVAREGEPYGQIVGNTFERTEAGEIVHNPDGLPVVADSQVVLGNQEPDWTAGWTNTFRWNNVTLQAQIDARWGNDIYSFTNATAYSNGRHRATLQGREQGFVVGDGVKQATDENGDVIEGEFVENDVEADPQDYYSAIGSNIDDPFVYDGSYVRLRSLRIGYAIPGSVTEAIPGISSAQVSISGRNLWLIYDNVPNVDPSGGKSTGADHGLEYASLPITRNFGFNLNVRF